MADLSDLIAKIEGLKARQSLKRQLIRSWEWQDGVIGRGKIEVAHLLVDGKAIRLTPEQLSELEGDNA